MNWILVADAMPEQGEEVIGMRADGRWFKMKWTKMHGWFGDGHSQPIVKWCRVAA